MSTSDPMLLAREPLPPRSTFDHLNAVTGWLLVLVLALLGGVVYLVVEVHGLRQDLRGVDVGSSTALDPGLDADVADLCRLIGAVATKDGLKPAAVFSGNASVSGCAEAATGNG